MPISPEKSFSCRVELELVLKYNVLQQWEIAFPGDISLRRKQSIDNHGERFMSMPALWAKRIHPPE